MNRTMYPGFRSRPRASEASSRGDSMDRTSKSFRITKREPKNFLRTYSQDMKRYKGGNRLSNISKKAMVSFNKLLRAIKKEDDEDSKSNYNNFFTNQKTLPQIWSFLRSDIEDKKPVDFRMESYCRHEGMIISQRKELPLVITFSKINPLISAPNRPPCSITRPDVNQMIDLRGHKTGLSEFGSLPNFTFYIAFNRYPTLEVYDLMYDTPEFIKLSKRMAVFITKRDSIRFLISTREKMDVRIQADFKGIFKPPIIDCSIKYYSFSDYAKILKNKVVIPKRILKKIQREKESQDNEANIVAINKNRAREMSFEKKTDRIRELLEVKEQRIVMAKSRRRLLLRRKRNKTIKGLNRFIQVKIQNQKNVNFLIEKFLGDTVKKVWIANILRIKILQDMKDRLYERKRLIFYTNILTKKAKKISSIAKMVILKNQEIKSEYYNDRDLVFTKMILQTKAGVTQRKFKERLIRPVGSFFKQIGRMLRVRNCFFDYKVYINSIQKRFRRHMAIKRESRKLFMDRIDDAMVHLLSIEEHKRYSSRYTKLRKELLEEIFYFEFNFQLLVFLDEKHESYNKKIENTKEQVLKLEREFEFYSSSDSEEEGESPSKCGRRGNRYRMKKLEKVLKFKKIRDCLSSKAMYVLYERIHDNMDSKKYDDYLEDMAKISDERRKLSKLYTQDSTIIEDSDNLGSSKKGKLQRNRPRKKKRRRKSVKRSSIYYLKKEKERQLEIQKEEEARVKSKEEFELKLKDKKFSKFVMEKMKIEALAKFEMIFDERSARYVVMTILDYFFPVYTE